MLSFLFEVNLCNMKLIHIHETSRAAYTPKEFAALVIQVIENSMLNGEVIRLDGAIRLSPR